MDGKENLVVNLDVSIGAPFSKGKAKIVFEDVSFEEPLVGPISWGAMDFS